MKKTIQEILELDFVRKNIVIIGHPKSGKTYLSEKIEEKAPFFKVIHTDDFMKFGYEDALYELMNKIEETANYVIVEGVLGYRLLRKGLQLKNFIPDIVINCMIEDSDLEAEYVDEYDKLPKVKSMIKGLDTIFYSYLGMAHEKMPEIYEFWNEKYGEDAKETKEDTLQETKEDTLQEAKEIPVKIKRARVKK